MHAMCRGAHTVAVNIGASAEACLLGCLLLTPVHDCLTTAPALYILLRLDCLVDLAQHS